MDVEHARRKRRKKYVALRAVAEGRLAVRDAVWDGHSALGTCPVHRVLEAAPGLGPEGVRKILERANVWPLLPLGELTELHRQAILDQLPGRIQ